MRKLVAVSLALIFELGCVRMAEAAVPQLINFQGILRSTAGPVLPDSTYSVSFRLYDADVGGTLLWEETQLVAAVTGSFNVLLGSNTPLTISDFNGVTWLGTQLGLDPEMTPRVRIASVGYAFQAENADKVDGYDASQFMSATAIPDVFRQTVTNPPVSGTVQVFGPTGRVRQITQIHFSFGGAYEVHIAGSVAIGATGDWTSGCGAAIEVGPSESVELVTLGVDPSNVITFIGFEY